MNGSHKSKLKEALEAVEYIIDDDSVPSETVLKSLQEVLIAVNDGIQSIEADLESQSSYRK